MKNSISSRCILLGSVLIATAFSSDVFADVITRTGAGFQVAEIHVRGLKAHAGQALQAFYVSGREATVAVTGQTLKVHANGREPVRALIDANGEAVLPQAIVPFGRFLSFNYILFEVTQPDLNQAFLRNADGTYPIDPRIKPADLLTLPDADFKTDWTGFVCVTKLNPMPMIAPPPGAQGSSYVQLDVAKDF